METTGDRFKKIRTELRLSQDDFGEKIGLSKSAVSAVENNKSFVSVEILRSLFMDMNINLNWLVVGNGEMYNPPEYEDIKEEVLNEVDKVLIKYRIKKQWV